jgi:hypothetical protein
MAVITILGMYQWNSYIFDDIKLPDGVDKTTLIDNLLIELAELEILYSDPDVMKASIDIWSRKQFRVWSRLAETFDLDYNPIWNVDGTETEIETHDLHASGSVKRTGQETGKVTGYNSDTLRTSDQMDSSADTNSTGSDTGTITRQKTRGGNIGVTMTQQMLSAELDVRPKLNIYSYIIEDFKQRFCLMIY